MLKTRIIGVIIVRENIAVQSICFNKYLPIGKPEIIIKYLDQWGVDEIVILHIQSSKAPDAEQIKKYAKKCQIPLAIGGGIRTIEDIKILIRAGADKVVLNKILLTNPHIITEASDLFGQQSIVVSIDTLHKNDDWLALTDSGKNESKYDPLHLAKIAMQFGAGEILLQSINRDGMKGGYDLNLIKMVSNAITLPIIACSGAGNPQHLSDVISAGANAVAVSNLFNFYEHSVCIVKQSINNLATVRIDNNIQYHDFHFDNGRITKLPDETLDKLRFKYIPQEKI